MTRQPAELWWGFLRIVARLVVFAVVALNLGVLLVVALSSLSDTAYLVFPPEGLTTRWYGELSGFTDPFWYSLRVSLIAATASTFLALLAGIGIVRGRVRAAGVVTQLATAPLIVPSIIYALGLIVVQARLDLDRNFHILTLGLVVLATPLALRVVLGGLAAIDWSLESAARSLGASRRAAWRLVILPLVMTSALIAWIFSFVVAFDDVVLGLFLATPREQTFAARLFLEVEQVTDPRAAAAATAMTAVTTVAFVVAALLSRLLRRRGLSAFDRDE